MNNENSETENEEIVVPINEEQVFDDGSNNGLPTSPELMQRIAELEVEVIDTKDKMVRAIAEAENVRKRSEKNRIDTTKFAISGFAKDLLAVSDYLNRALSSIPEEELPNNEFLKSMFDGVSATERELARVFETNGIKKVEPLNQTFDPNLHEVMFEAEIPDQMPGTIIEVMDCGYTLNGRLLRPARVGVAKGGTPKANTNIDQEV